MRKIVVFLYCQRAEHSLKQSVMNRTQIQQRTLCAMHSPIVGNSQAENGTHTTRDPDK